MEIPYQTHFFFWDNEVIQLLLFDSENNKHPIGMPHHIKNSFLRYNPCPLYTFSPLNKKMVKV